MKIVIAGASGMLGRALAAEARARGHQVLCLVRREPRQSGEARWDPAAGLIEAQVLDGADLVVNLCGAGIADRPWTPRRRLELRESRILSTRTLVSAMERSGRRPALFACASAVGYYGDRGDEVLREESRPGEGFLADLCRDWEGEAARAQLFGTRTQSLRFGVVLSPEGGMLARLLPAFRLGLGCTLGDGRAWLSWISLEDAVGAILALPTLGLREGGVNLCSPGALRGGDFNRVLSKHLRRPLFLRVPAPVLSAALGGLAREALLASTRAEPAALLGAGHVFRHPDLASALSTLL